ncbi:hypothetical protein CCUS01_09339 [Colletotrichum cuscutae]|uniref:Uncharacterized protein n=1 Tax=Colletotrichum cuscutae TaxID=1209917 RepID=A0AAI9UM32_9PEZI|nr:hypothetical protein CCUS01_09339 [Colletotrichum cuscutae]
MIQQRPARYKAPLRVTTTPNRAPHKNRLFVFLWPMPMPVPTEYLHRYAYHLRPGTRRGLVDAPCDPGRSAPLNLRSFQQLLRCPPANPSLAHFAYLTLRSRAACLAQLRLVLPASLPRTNGGYEANSTTTTDFRAPTF